MTPSGHGSCESEKRAAEKGRSFLFCPVQREAAVCEVRDDKKGAGIFPPLFVEVLLYHKIESAKGAGRWSRPQRASALDFDDGVFSEALEIFDFLGIREVIIPQRGARQRSQAGSARRLPR